MKKLFFKSLQYTILLLLSLEILVSIFHLAKDNPIRYLDKHNVEKWKPNQQGFSVTGNRRQNFSEFRINNSGFNSYREFTPTKEKEEIAIIGDSFIEGFHQDYYNSLGKKIENNLPDTEVYEYGYAGYDMADQLHLIHQYKEQFDLIDHVIISLTYDSDLLRKEYKVVQDRLNLESTRNRLLKKSNLLVYSKNMGLFDPLVSLINNIKNLRKSNAPKTITKSNKKDKKEQLYISNFENLIKLYGYDKERFVLLLDSEKTSPEFMTFLNRNGFDYIDFSQAFSKSQQPTTLIYDQHWNDHGRTIIANLIVDYLQTKRNSQ